ncbi:MAG: cytochrome b/b6 domain-containing protein [Spongiibacteraceae bacterium]
MPSPSRVTIWDLPVRVFHWSVATLFLLNYWVLEAGETPHEWVGYAIGALLFFRIIWGFIGSPNARFANFWPTPTRLRHHWQQLKTRDFNAAEGHNPLGALMIFFILTLLAITAISGWMQGLDRFWGEDWVEDLHEIAANTLMAAVTIHVAAVIVMSRISGLRLIRTMLFGWRPASIDKSSR